MVFVSNNVQKGQAKGSGSKGTKNTFSHFPLNLTPPPDSLSRFYTPFQDTQCMLPSSCYAFIKMIRFWHVIVLPATLKNLIPWLIHTSGSKGNTCQGCALRKIEGSPVHWTCKIQGAQHMICMKNLRFSSHPGAKVWRQGPPGSARAQPCMSKLV